MTSGGCRANQPESSFLAVHLLRACAAARQNAMANAGRKVMRSCALISGIGLFPPYQPYYIPPKRNRFSLHFMSFHHQGICLCHHYRDFTSESAKMRINLSTKRNFSMMMNCNAVFQVETYRPMPRRKTERAASASEEFQ
jgi:hypothetical protein